MNLPEFGVKNPVANLMIFCAIIILAAYSRTRIGVDLMPKIEPAVITVISIYPGANPEDVEAKVTETLENQLATTPGLEKINSWSGEGVSVVSLKFIWGTNIVEASNDVRDRIDLAKGALPDIPDEMQNPFIWKFNTSDIPIIFVGVTAGRSYPELYNLIDNRVGDVLRQIPGVGTVSVHGGLERQINISIDRARLEAYGFSILDIQNALKQENITQPLGKIKSGLTDYLLRLPGEFAKPEDINLVILGKRNGNFVYLKDVARVEDSFKEVIRNVRINRIPGILLMVQKQAGTNTVEVASRVKRKVAELNKSLPSDVKMIVVFDTSQDILNSLSTLTSSLWVAVVLVVLVVWFFLRQFASSMIIALTIPFSLLISFIYIFLSDKTINTVSLSSIAIASGMVVDNAIVIVDNIYRRIERKFRPVEAAIFGAKEMFLSVAASTLTTVVVFLPMLFIPGVVGIMFGELAIIVTVTLLASLFTAVTFSPMLCSKWMKNAPRPDAENNAGLASRGRKWSAKLYDVSERWFKGGEDFYAGALTWSLRHKKIIIFGFTAVFFASLTLLRFIGNEFIPEEDSGDIRISTGLPIGTRLEETDKVARRIEDIITKEAPELKFSYVRSGYSSGKDVSYASGTHVIAAGLKLVPKTQRKRSVKDVAQAIRDKIKAIPGIDRIDISTGNPMGRIVTGGGGKSIQVEIIGHSFEETNALAEKVKQIMEKTPGAVDASVSRDLNRPELKIEVDREKAGSLGLDMRTIASSIKTFIEGTTATKYREMGDTYDISVRLEEASRSKLEDIENLTVVSPATGKQIRLGNFVRVYESLGPEGIERQNRERVVGVECNTYKRSPGKIVEDLKTQLEKIILPKAVIINFGGEAEEQQKAFKDLSLLLILGILLVYMVMAAQFGSLLDPFIVMFAVPFTFTGVILGFILTRTTLSIITYLGIVMLMGIVVNNAIVLISYINILRARGLSVLEAVTQGGRDRLRPVLMTTITTVAGILPLALSRGEGSEIWQPLGITMIGGLSVSTLITMLFVPTLYAVFESRIKNGRGKK